MRYGYDEQTSYLATETRYDLISVRYMVVGLRNEEPCNTQYGLTAKAFEYTHTRGTTYRWPSLVIHLE
ncbi:hypothetical protein [Pseudomonas sp. C2B4]|uniref:hypothetical protein n=1 Tax=Pseudomonas sp. C2B4 TaxID=2735270 RepID=UPI0021148A3C|nr:hypothetical protein [Pseudomonas sp. C2B4]